MRSTDASCERAELAALLYCEAIEGEDDLGPSGMPCANVARYWCDIFIGGRRVHTRPAALCGRCAGDYLALSAHAFAAFGSLYAHVMREIEPHEIRHHRVSGATQNQLTPHGRRLCAFAEAAGEARRLSRPPPDRGAA